MNGVKGAIDFLRTNLKVQTVSNLPFATILVPLSVFFASPGDEFVQVFARGARGSALCERGDALEALSCCWEAAELADRSQNQAATAMAQGWLAQAYVCAGEPEPALAAAGRARAAGEQARQVGALYHAATWSGEAHLLAGDTARACTEFERLAEINDTWASTRYRQARARLLSAHYEEAAELARACLDANPIFLTRARALCTLGQALGLGSCADREGAEAALLESARLCEQRGLRPALAEAKRALAELTRGWGEPERAERYAAEAEALL